MNLSDSAKYTAFLKRVACTDYDTWAVLAKHLHPSATRFTSTDQGIVYDKVDKQEHPSALWHHEYQMGYIVLP